MDVRLDDDALAQECDQHGDEDGQPTRWDTDVATHPLIPG
jgi:hypothetical protein